jgi:hypothetical protein
MAGKVGKIEFKEWEEIFVNPQINLNCENFAKPNFNLKIPYNFFQKCPETQV